MPVAGIPIIAVHTIAPDHEAVQTVAPIDTSYPSFSQAQNWDSVEFFQFVKMQAPPDSPDTRVAARIANGLPLLVDRKVGEGHVADIRLGFRQRCQQPADSARLAAVP